jgi:hypothetical protein
MESFALFIGVPRWGIRTRNTVQNLAQSQSQRQRQRQRRIFIDLEQLDVMSTLFSWASINMVTCR